jgi:hypothetical protein
MSEFIADPDEGFLALEWESGESISRSEPFFCEFKKMNLAD